MKSLKQKIIIPVLAAIIIGSSLLIGIAFFQAQKIIINNTEQICENIVSIV